MGQVIPSAQSHLRSPWAAHETGFALCPQRAPQAASHLLCTSTGAQTFRFYGVGKHRNAGIPQNEEDMAREGHISTLQAPSSPSGSEKRRVAEVCGRGSCCLQGWHVGMETPRSLQSTDVGPGWQPGSAGNSSPMCWTHGRAVPGIPGPAVLTLHPGEAPEQLHLSLGCVCALSLFSALL